MQSEVETSSPRPQVSHNSAQQSAQLDSGVFNFLTENSYIIHNDNGYLTLDELIDDNPDIFPFKFEMVVRKSLSLIYYSDNAKNLSSGKKRLREQLLGVFEGTRSLILMLGSDPNLLLSAYAVLFKCRIGVFTKEGPTIKSSLFGEKGARAKIRLLNDSVMFYILKRDPNRHIRLCENFLGRDPSPVNKRSTTSSCSPCKTIKLILNELSRLSDPGRSSRSLQYKTDFQTDLQKYKLVLNCVQDQIDGMASQRKLEFPKPRGSRKKSESHPQPQRVSPTHDLRSGSNSSFHSWHDFKPRASGLSGDKKTESGMLVSYSASRQCGLILAQNELEVLVVNEELRQAGVPEELLERSRGKIRREVQFGLHKLSSEPVATFEAVNLAFVELPLF